MSMWRTHEIQMTDHEMYPVNHLNRSYRAHFNAVVVDDNSDPIERVYTKLHPYIVRITTLTDNLDEHKSDSRIMLIFARQSHDAIQYAADQYCNMLSVELIRPGAVLLVDKDEYDGYRNK